jgi:hypothetical protein
MHSKRASSRTLLVAAVAGLLIGLGLAVPADSAVTPSAPTPIYLTGPTPLPSAPPTLSRG